MASECDNCGIEWEKHSPYCGMTQDEYEQQKYATRLDAVAGSCANCDGDYSAHPDEYDGHVFVPSSRKARKAIEADHSDGKAFITRNFRDRRKG